MRLGLIFATPFLLSAQLIPAGQPVLKTANPPVVFLNGYQSSCSGGSDFASNFSAADKLLQANGLVSLYFDNCTVGAPGSSVKPSLEAEGIAFGQFLAALKYTDGTSVPVVDVVGHSLGGLIVRSYLAGKQDVTPALFKPPAAPQIRKAIFLATPNFGTTVAAAFGFDKQTQQMSPGSQFLFDLNTWNQGTDDLRGISAISIAGNGGTGSESKIAGFDDGVVALTSSSLSFYRPGATRLVPFCHTSNSLLVLAGFCAASTPALNNLSTDPNNPVGKIIVSFLTGTSDWQSVGQAGEANPILSATAGVNLQLRDANDTPLQLSGAQFTGPTGPTNLSINPSNIAYAEALPANGKTTFQIGPATGTTQTATLALPATTELSAVVKPGPVISPKGVIPAAGPAPFPYDVAPGAYVSVYGSNLASAAQSATQPYPTQLTDVQVLVDGVAQPLVYVSSGQINFVYANSSPGLTVLTVKNANGQNSVNVRVAPAVPSIFPLDVNATAAAVNALTGVVVGVGAPIHANDFLSLYLTGLGATTRTNGLDYASIQPTITVGGQNCPVTYAGRSPGFAGLDQINCKIPVGVTTGNTVPVVVTSNGRVSATATLAIQ